MGEMHKTALSGVVAGVARVTPPEPEQDCAKTQSRSHGMDGIRDLLSAARDAGLAAGYFRGLLHIAIGRRVVRGTGAVLSTGVTWRELAADLKHLRYDTDLVRELGADPEALAARDRERFWYSAIALARVDSREAIQEADRLAQKLAALGFVVGPAPGGSPPPAPQPHPQRPRPEPKAKEKPSKPVKKKKK
jgi:hypothetical protein